MAKTAKKPKPETIFIMEPIPPKNWKEFEEACARLHFRASWSRNRHDDTLQLHAAYHDDFWEQYPTYSSVDLRWGLEIYRRVEKSDLNASKRWVVEHAPEILAEIQKRIDRLAALLPLLEFLGKRNEEEERRYDRVTVQLTPSEIRLNTYDWQLNVNDDLTIESAAYETRGKMTTDELHGCIDRLAAVVLEYEQILEPFRKKGGASCK